jgi:hypothetical protein
MLRAISLPFLDALCHKPLKARAIATNVPENTAPATFASGCSRYYARRAVGNGKNVTSRSTKPFQYKKV